MTKEELAKRLRCLEGENKNHGTEIKIALKELAELAEKPKLRHGDFGYNNLGYPRLILLSKDEELFDAGKLYCDPVIGGYSHPLPDPILGNIFDLLKEWSEDLTFFEFDVHHCEINTKEFAHAPIHIAGNWHTLAEAEEIWHKLGRLLATYKRKENKCS